MRKKGKKLYIILAVVIGIIVIVANSVCLAMQDMLNKYTVGTVTDISSQQLDEIYKDGKALAMQIESEGAVLLENNGLLPLQELSKVNVFGWASTQWVTNGSGSGGVAGDCTDFLNALENNNIAYNKTLTDMYRKFSNKREYWAAGSLHSDSRDFCKLYEPPLGSSHYNDKMLGEAKAFSDTAIVVIGRVNGESNDAPRSQYKFNADTDKSRDYLELSKEEEDLLTYVGSNYDKVIVLINSTNTMELGRLKGIAGLDATLLVGCTGTYGAEVIPDILKGKVSPSGKLTDTYAYDLSTAATYVSSGFEGLGKYTNGEGLYPFDGKTLNGNLSEAALYEQVAFVDYAENIYVGYKWYETAEAEEFWDSAYAQTKWGIANGYNDVVQYPFGYGKSYSEFSFTPVGMTENNGEITVGVTVKNKGYMNAKEVVQLYYSAPYTDGGIEKSAVELADFAKTKVLAPGEEQTLYLKLNAEDMASYDCYDANANDFRGYELEAGTYALSLRTDAHNIIDGGEYKYEVATTVQDDKASNLFTGDSAVDGVGIDDTASITYMTRDKFLTTFPAVVTDREISETIASYNLYTAKDAEDWIKADDKDIVTDKDNGLVVYENGRVNALGIKLGKDYNDVQWSELLDQLGLEEMKQLVLHNGYGVSRALPSIGKPLGYEADGPTQIGSFNLPKHGTGFPNPTTIAQTWNKKLAYDFGRQVGREADALGYRGWYGPGCNLHRSAVGGRNYEYYSEDSVLSGIFTTEVAKGALSTGTYMYLKHFVAYDQEAYRDGVYTWMTEQTLRETYAKPFEMSIKEGGVTGLMTAYNRLGAVWAGGSYGLLTSLLREEWGFKGAVLTDYSDHHDYMCFDQALRAGGDIWMDGVMNSGKFAFETESNTFKQALRTASKNLIYIWLNAYAAAETSGFVKCAEVSVLPWWGILLIVIDVAYVSAFAVWGVLKFRKKS